MARRARRPPLHLAFLALLTSVAFALAFAIARIHASSSVVVAFSPSPPSISSRGLGGTRTRGCTTGGGGTCPRLGHLTPLPSNSRIIIVVPSSRVTLATTMSSSTSRSTDGGDGVDAAPPATTDEVGRCSDSTRSYFRGRSILLTGASGGLGRALAILLCRDCGPRRLVLSGRDPTRVEAVADECRRFTAMDDEDSSSSGDGGDTGVGEGVDTEVQVIPCDLSDVNSVKELASRTLEGGNIDVLVNNGGMSSRSTFLETSAEVDELVMRVNFLSGAGLAKAVVPGMMKANGGKGGAVVWISSVQGLVGIPNRSSYAASKFAVQGYCESLRAELAPEGVNVCVVSPGYIRTNLSRSAVMGDGSKYGRMDPTTAGGADPFDVARTVLDSVASGRSDVIVAAGLSARVAIWLRFLLPSALERLLVSRYEKSRREGQPEEEEE